MVPAQCDQVVMHLVTNARDALQANGRITAAASVYGARNPSGANFVLRARDAK